MANTAYLLRRDKIADVTGTDMRLSHAHIAMLKRSAAEEASPSARLRLFGSRLDDTGTGGDVDLLLELPEPVSNPAVLAATLSARASCAMNGRKVDVALSAPNLQRLAIHEVALRDGALF